MTTVMCVYSSNVIEGVAAVHGPDEDLLIVKLSPATVYGWKNLQLDGQAGWQRICQSAERWAKTGHIEIIYLSPSLPREQVQQVLRCARQHRIPVEQGEEVIYWPSKASFGIRPNQT